MKLPVKALSNVIELKSEKKYLLVFSSTDANTTPIYDDAKALMKALEDLGITSLSLALRKEDKLEVIEA